MVDDVIKGDFGGSLTAKQLANDLLEMNLICNRFRAIERSIHFRGVEGKERNGEHAFQLGFMGVVMNNRAKLGLDNEKIMWRALTHDFPEIIAEDTPMFTDVFRPGDKQPNPIDKRAREEAAFVWLKNEYGQKHPEFIESIRAYLDQSDDESRYISALEKLIAVINIYQDEGRSWRHYAVPIEEADRRHRERASKHPAVKDWYEIVLDIVWKDADARPNLYPVMPPPGQRKRTEV